MDHLIIPWTFLMAHPFKGVEYISSERTPAEDLQSIEFGRHVARGLWSLWAFLTSRVTGLFHKWRHYLALYSTYWRKSLIFCFCIFVYGYLIFSNYIFYIFGVGLVFSCILFCSISKLFWGLRMVSLLAMVDFLTHTQPSHHCPSDGIAMYKTLTIFYNI